jgi:(1->4)-alpha-D-glucan 1-alpha-D-glucosylmutase
MTRRKIATYRLQLTPHFRFAEAQRLLPYLRDLGVSHVYLSPIFEARRGSEHGYDVTDPTRFRTEFGGTKGFDAFAIAARDLGLGLVMDVVPNHMAASPENPYFRDVLEAGSQSPFAMWFDVDWDRPLPGPAGRVVLPLLHESLREALAQRRLQVEFGGPGFEVLYRGSRLPVHPRSWRTILELHLPQLASVLGTEHPGYRALIEALHDAERLRESMEARPSSLQELDHSRRAIAGRIRSNMARYPEFAVYLQEVLRVVNGGEKRVGTELLRSLLDDQGYALVDWHTDSTRLNWRRYLEINELIAVRVDEPEVFRWTHELLLEQLGRGAVDGVRIDHVDGLRDPVEYLARLRIECGRRGRRDVWILAETMNAPGETLPTDFDADGATGYDFLNAFTRAFAPRVAWERLDAAFAKFAGTRLHTRFVERLRLLREDFAPYLDQVVDVLFFEFEFARGRREPTHRDRDAVRFGFELLTAALPVGRTFLRGGASSKSDRKAVESACGALAALDVDGVDAAELAAQYVLDAHDGEFVARWQSLCLLLHVREHEEIRLNRETQWLGFNEPGSEPTPPRTEDPARWFHSVMATRAAAMPRTLNATSTHDTRRSEDVRARLLALLEAAQEFEQLVRTWRTQNRRFARKVGGRYAPDGALEWLIYQTLVAAWPKHDGDVDAFAARLVAHARKVAREARFRTNWITPDEDFEEAVRAFIDGILHPAAATDFRASLEEFAERIAARGARWSLLQVAMRALCPGVPDLYQGQEFFDFSLGDPDNRRPVDFGRRARALETLRSRPRSVAEWTRLVDAWRDGRVKLALIADLLALRRSQEAVFERGRYVPLKLRSANGTSTGLDLAFARTAAKQTLVVCTNIGTPPSSPSPANPAARPLQVALSTEIPAITAWHEVLSGEPATLRVRGRSKTLELAVPGDWPLPVAVFLGEG